MKATTAHPLANTSQAPMKTTEWLDTLDCTGHACDRDDTFNLVVHKGDTPQRTRSGEKLVKVDPRRPWNLTLRKGSTLYRSSQYLTRENALKSARRRYNGLMRQQPTGDDGHEVNPATGRTIRPCGCIACAGVETDCKTAVSGAGDQDQTPREAVERWAPKWSVSGLKARGWTDAMIRDYLGEEDVLAPNPHYRSAPPMRLYYQDRCLEAEESAGFSERATKAAERSEASKAAAVDRAPKLSKWAETVEITWFDPPEDTAAAIELGVKSWEAWNGTKVDEADDETLIRWASNYLRHECLSYNYLLERLSPTDAVIEAYMTIRHRCEKMIAERYPTLERPPSAYDDVCKP